MKIYTGVGSRQTPSDVLQLMTDIAARLATDGWTLRSGHADGADLAFEDGCIAADGAADIYLPWKGFNGSRSDLHHVGLAAYGAAAEIHPAWDKCSAAARKLHARNIYQVLGHDFDREGGLFAPSSLLICWTKGGLPVGGTRTAIVLARRHSIPVHNLAIAKVREAYERRVYA